MENPELILPWIFSFDGVTNSDLDSFSSLRSGHVLAKIFNQIQGEDVIDLNSLKPVDQSKDDWISCLRNMKTLQSHIRGPFSNCQIQSTFDITSIARRSNADNSLKELVEAFILFSLKGPKKAENIERVKKLPKETIKMIQEIIQKKRTQNKDDAKIVKSEKGQPKQQIEQIIQQLDTEKANLKKANEDLKNEIQTLKNKGTEYQQFYELNLKKEEIIKENQKLDEEINLKENLEEKKNQLQAQLNEYKKNINQVKEQELMIKSLKVYERSTDHKVINYLNEIHKIEDTIEESNILKIEKEYTHLKKILKKLASDIKSKKDIIENYKEIDEDQNDIENKLSNEIEMLIDKNNQLNHEIIELVKKTELIEQLNTPESLLEKMRIANQNI